MRISGRPESAIGHWLHSFLLVLIGTGFSHYFFAAHSSLWQIVNLLHILFGVLLFLTLFPYLFFHVMHTHGVRRLGMFLTGIPLLAALATSVYTGLQMMWQGQLESQLARQSLHLNAAIIVTLFVVMHILLHRFSLPKHRKNKPDGYYKTLTKLPTAFTVTIVGALSFTAILYFTDLYTNQAYSELPAVEDYQYRYGPHPFKPSLTTTEQQKFIDIKALNNSDKCAICHADIAKQWQASAHRQAASDKSYETNVTLLAQKKGIAATRYCEGCHAPLALLSGELSEGGTHGGVDDSIANREGVNCQSCHGISDIVNTKGVASYHMSIPSPYLFETSDNLLLKQLNLYLIRLSPQQHRKDMNSPIISDSSYCASCHAQFIDRDVNDWGWIQMQDEYSAWLGSPFSGGDDPKFAASKKQRCQDCHMPLVAADDPSANSENMVRDHRFIAANTMLPTLNGDKKHLQLTKDFLQANKVQITIDPPARKKATESAMRLNESLRAISIQPHYYYRGETAQLKVIVSNTGVGHNFPGGTVDINQVWVELSVVDAEGIEIYSNGNVNKQGILDHDAYQYRSIPVDRKGNHVWQHDLFNMVGKSSMNVIKAGESDVVDYQFVLPYWVKGPISVSAVVKYRKFNTRYAKWALQEEYQALPIVDMARAFLTIPVRTQIEATDNYQ